MKGFLYGQTEYNMLQNINRLDDYISYAKKNSFDFLSITDSNMYGHYKFYKKCLSAGIKPIIGLEYMFKTEDQNYSKALLYARNNIGFTDLLKITSKVKIEKIESLEDIIEYKDNLNVIFVFNDSFLERTIQSKEYMILDEYSLSLKRFPNLFIGISYTNQLNKLDLNKEMENYANAHNLACVPIHQCKYLENKDIMVYEALCEIGNLNVKIKEYEDYSFDGNPIIDSSLSAFVQSIQLNLFENKIDLPRFPNTKGAESKDFLSALCYKGLERRKCMRDVYVKRLEFELSTIDNMGYNDYFLIVWDFVKYAKQKSILVGPGRGSAAGSLVAYSLGITEVDPIKYDLLFERFLNPERVSMPDIDIDFPDVSRDDVIQHVRDLYGAKHVCNISAYATFLMKSSIRDLARIKKMENSRTEKIIEMVEKYGFDYLLQQYEGQDLYDFIYTAKGLVGLPRHITTHAAGIILSNSELNTIIPLQEGINGLYQSQLEASDLEKIGLLKMDFLGIRNLTLIEEMMKSIPGFNSQKLRNIPLNDVKVFELLKNADTLGIFQLESDGIRNVLKKLKPTCFEDLVAVLALYRPGPMDNIDEFIRRKHMRNFEYLHPSLQPILESTYGIIVYQEQIMKIAQVFAGYSLGEADVLRRAVSKKDVTALVQLEENFINKSIQKGYSKGIAKEIYDLILKFANYGFNRSHSVAYGILSYQMAYLKANYFSVFMANILNNVIGSTKTMVSYIKYAKERLVVTYKPNVNVSSTKFCTTKLGLFMPLNAIFSIGEVVAKQIVEEREKNGNFKNFNNFKQRCSFLTSQNLQALIFSGALDIFGETKKSMCSQTTKEDEIFLRHLKGVIQDASDYEIEYLREMELKYLGLNLEYSIFKNFEILSRKCKTIPLHSARYHQPLRFLVAITDFKEIKTKKNERMMVGRMEDVSVEKKFVIFPKLYSSLNIEFKPDCLYLILAILEKDKNNDDSVNILKIAPMNPKQ